MKILARLLRCVRGTRSSAREANPVPAHVAIRNGRVFTQVGPAAILHGLFSTISHNLEPDGWGSRFPAVMNDLYRGRLDPPQMAAALIELQLIARELQETPVSRVVWDIERPDAPPSPHYTLGATATNAADFFVTVTGRHLLRDALIDSVESAIEYGDEVEIVSFGSPADFFRSGA